MPRWLFQSALWLLVLIQGVGVCRCLAEQADEPARVAQTQLSRDVPTHQDAHPERNADQASCDGRASARPSCQQPNLFAASLTRTINPSQSLALLALPSSIDEPASPPLRPHEGARLPLQI